MADSREPRDPKEPVVHPPVVHHKDRLGWPLVALIAAAIMLIVIFALAPSSPKQAAPAPRAEAPDQPDSGQLQLSDLNMTLSPPRAGLVSVKIVGRVQNAGQVAVNGATLEATFLDGSGGVALQQAQPIARVKLEGQAEKDVALKEHPLKTNDKAAFEVEFTGVPADWDQKMPQLRIADVASDAPPQPIATNMEGTAKPSPVTPKRSRRSR